MASFPDYKRNTSYQKKKKGKKRVDQEGIAYGPHIHIPPNTPGLSQACLHGYLNYERL